MTTIKKTGPVCTFFLLSFVVAFNLLLDLAAVAPSINLGGTSTTEAFVAGPWTGVLPAWHYVTADGTKAPTRPVVRFGASSYGLLFAAVTTLFGAHCRAWWARAGGAQ